MPTTYKLTYFNGYGRAETTRILFAVWGMKFEDERLTQDQWKDRKKGTPWGTLPVLEIKGPKPAKFGDSASIAKFVAKEAGLMGSNSVDYTRIDEIYGKIVEIMDQLAPLSKLEDEEKQKAFEELQTNFLSKRLQQLEEKVKPNKGGDGGFFMGKISLADIHLFTTMEGIQNRNPDFSTTLEKYPNLNSIVEKVRTHEKIKDYLAKRPETSF